MSADNTAIAQSMDGVSETMNRLNETLERGVIAPIYLDGNDGLMHRIKEYNRLQENK